MTQEQQQQSRLFSTAFDTYWRRADAYWDLPMFPLGCLAGFWARKWLGDKSAFFTADTSVLPQLSELDKCFPDAVEVDMCCSSCLCFRLPSWPKRLMAHVQLESPPISFIAVQGDFYQVNLVQVKKNTRSCLFLCNGYDLNTVHKISNMEKIQTLVDDAHVVYE